MLPAPCCLAATAGKMRCVSAACAACRRPFHKCSSTEALSYCQLFACSLPYCDLGTTEPRAAGHCAEHACSAPASEAVSAWGPKADKTCCSTCSSCLRTSGADTADIQAAK